jgi:ABC-2 type transport system permease protein
LMLGSIALFLSSVIKQLENFAGVMNYIIFPMIFFSTALGPLWRIKQGSLLLYQIASLNPFTHAVELIRFGFYGKFGAIDPEHGFDPTHLLVVCGCTTVFLLAAIYAYNPSKGLIGRRGGPGGGA